MRITDSALLIRMPSLDTVFKETKKMATGSAFPY